MSTQRMFPLQTSGHAPPGPLQIPWSIAEKAYGAYASRYGRAQSLERLAERGGFGWCEMDRLYPAWRTEVDELSNLRAEHERVKAAFQKAADYVAADTNHVVIDWSSPVLSNYITASAAVMVRELDIARIALLESLELQSHYAGLLNGYDSGKRVGFSSVDEWIGRLKECGKLPG